MDSPPLSPASSDGEATLRDIHVEVGPHPRPWEDRARHKLQDAKWWFIKDFNRRQRFGHRFKTTGCWSLGYTPDQIRMMGLAVPRNRVRHDGCVNCCSWTEDGRTLLTGSDDRLVKMWDAADSFHLKATLATGHRHNIFQVASVPRQPCKVVTCAADGSLRMMDVETEVEVLLGQSYRMIHGFCFWDGGPGCSSSNILLTAQADGNLGRYDLRQRSHEGCVILKMAGAIKAVAVPPPDNQSTGLSPWGLWVGASGPEIKVYDLRRMPRVPTQEVEVTAVRAPEPVRRFCPYGLPRTIEDHYDDEGLSVSGLVISKDRPEVLVSYQGEQIYAYATDDPEVGHEAYSLGGHLNQATFLKNVGYFGPREEYVVSGGDQGIIWIWDRASGRVVNLLKSDETVANGSAPHPYLPLLASYGIESTVKVWCVGGEAEDTKEACFLPKRDEMIEANLRSVSTSLGSRYRASFCRNVPAFRQRAQYLRSPDGWEWGRTDGYLPSYVSDYASPVGEWGSDMMEKLQVEKDKGNDLFKENKLVKAAESYEKVLRYLKAWGDTDTRAVRKGGNGQVAIKEINPLIAGLDLNQGGERQEEVDEAQKRQLEVVSSLNLAACRLSQKNYREAWRLADEVLKIQPRHPKALYRRACAAYEMQNYEDAVADLTEAQKLEKKDKAVGRKLAEAKKALQTFQERQRRAYKAAFGGRGGE